MGLVSKLGCNLRKSPGSVGSGRPSWGGKAPHLAEKGGALGCGDGGHAGRRHRLPPAPLPWPGWVPGTQGPLSAQRESISRFRGQRSALERTGRRGCFLIWQPPGANSCVYSCLILSPLLPATKAVLPQPPPRFWSFTAVSPSAVPKQCLAHSRCSERICCPRVLKCMGRLLVV